GACGIAGRPLSTPAWPGRISPTRAGHAPAPASPGSCCGPSCTYAPSGGTAWSCWRGARRSNPGAADQGKPLCPRAGTHRGTLSPKARRTAVRGSLRDLASRALWKVGPTRPARMARDRLTVATFHRVLPERYRREYAYPGLVVTPEELEEFLGFFAHHYAVDTLARSLARWKEGGAADRPLVAVTFDDGQAANFEYARPVVEKAGLRATFFIPAGHVEEGAALWHDRLGFAVRRAIEREPARVAELAPELSHDPAVAQDSQRAPRTLASSAKALGPEERD